jgi:WXG100 family type VII secretion target
MADGINISLDQVSSTASTIGTINTQLTQRLQDIKQQMNSLASTWQSDASNTIIGNFNALAPKFEEYQKVVDSYVKFLNDTVTAYQHTEQAINNNASAFK